MYMKTLFSQNQRDGMPAVSMPGSMSGAMQDSMSGTMPRNMQDSMSGTMPRNMQDSMSGTMPRNMQDSMSGTMPRNMQDSMSGTMPRTMHGSMSGSMPESTGGAESANTNSGTVSGGNNSGMAGTNTNIGNNMEAESGAGTATTQENNQAVTPLPNPGEGGPVFSGPSGGTTGGGTSGGTTGGTTGGITGTIDLGNRPVTPLPNPGEGGPVYPGTTEGTGGGLGGLNIPSIIGTIITSFPRPNAPCRFCANQSQTYGNVRFLNAAAGYNPFRVYVNDQLFVSPLNFSEVTSYEKVPSGYQIVTVMGDNQYIYVQKPIMVPRDSSVTVAICNTENGIDLFVVSDNTCNRSNFVACMRVCNLSVNSGPLSVILGNNDLRFMNVAYQEVSNFKVITPANYIFYVINGTRSIILSSSVDVKADISYTMYLFNWNISSPDAITVLIVEEHQ